MKTKCKDVFLGKVALPFTSGESIVWDRLLVAVHSARFGSVIHSLTVSVLMLTNVYNYVFAVGLPGIPLIVSVLREPRITVDPYDISK